DDCHRRMADHGSTAGDQVCPLAYLSRSGRAARYPDRPTIQLERSEAAYPVSDFDPHLCSRRVPDRARHFSPARSCARDRIAKMNGEPKLAAQEYSKGNYRKRSLADCSAYPKNILERRASARRSFLL